ncbi:hypothetical protein EVG20_g6773 [Dentipellis fragilis]|uniref:Uncharacterized protein n=1 Tax=Dentipellis fragilis TaxID=205917 RepID=A0A4Y9YL87_9AGAM|nr:hypothetical protein EVG20_g6773 [Dentipellis fragilis]
MICRKSTMDGGPRWSLVYLSTTAAGSPSPTDRRPSLQTRASALINMGQTTARMKKPKRWDRFDTAPAVRSSSLARPKTKSNAAVR